MATFPFTGRSDAAAMDSGQGIKRNFLHLLKGRGVAGVLSLGATAAMARALDPAAFGLVMLIHTYLLTARALINIKPFEAIIRYGVAAQEQGQDQRIRRLLGITFKLDLGVVALGTLVAVGAVPLLAPLFEWPDETVAVVMVYGLLLLSSPTGTANGILRLYDRFDLLGLRQALGPLVQLIGVLIAWWLEAGYLVFLAAYGSGWVTENLLMIGFGHREYRRRLGGTPPAPTGEDGHREAFPGLWRFLHVVYWQSNLDMIPKRLAVLGVGALLGSAAGGMFRLAQQFATVLSIPALLLRQVLFPDLARLWYRNDPRFPGLVRRILWIALATGGSVAALTLVAGKPVIETLVGESYLPALWVLFWLMLSAGLDMGVAALRAAGYAMGMAGRLLRVYLLSLLVYGVLFLWLAQVVGLAGTGLASACWSLLVLAALGWLLRRQLRRSGGA